MALNEWINLTDGSYKGFTFHVAIPTAANPQGIGSEEVELERRIQQIDRPLVDGAKISDFGRKSEVYTAEIYFHGPNYQQQYKAFLAVISDGVPGPLTLPTEPKTVQAAFWKLSRRADASGGNLKVVRVTWVEHNDQVVGSLNQKSIDSTKSDLDSKISTAKSKLQDNIFLTAVRGFESGLSTVRRASNMVLTLTDGVRNRIKQLDANVSGTLNLLKQTTDEIYSVFGKAKDTSASLQATAQTAKVPAAARFDSTTGQRIADFTEPDTVAPAVDPLQKPPISPQIDVPQSNVDTNQGVQIFVQKAVAQMKADRDELLSNSSGRISDVASALTAVMNSLEDFGGTIQTPSVNLVVVPREMTLMEVLFLNGVSLDNLNLIHQSNTHIDDPLVVPAGTVVAL